MDVLCVTCARVRFGSIMISSSLRETFESFHLRGRNIFQLQPWY